MAKTSRDSLGSELKKLTEYVEEIVGRTQGKQSRGKDSVEAIVEWLQRTYFYRNDDSDQTFQVVVSTPKITENQAAFDKFCATLAFAGRCVPTIEASESTEAETEESDSASIQAAANTKELFIEIALDVTDTAGLTPPYVVSFKLDPKTFFEEGLTKIEHLIPKSQPGATEIEVAVTSQHGEFNVSMTPPTPPPGQVATEKHVTVQSGVEFTDFAGEPTFYQLKLSSLESGDIYSISGEYQIAAE